MIRRHLMALRLILMVADGITGMLVFLVVSLIRFGDGQSAEIWLGLGIDIRLAAAVFGIVWVIALWSWGLYRLRARWSLMTEARDIAKTTLVVLIITLAMLFVVHRDAVSRLFLVLLFLVQPVVTLAGRAALRAVFGAIRLRGHNSRNMLIVGTGTLAQDFADRIESRPALGIRIIGHLSVPGEPDGVVSRPILGTLDVIATIFHSQVVDEVAVCLPPTAVADWADSVALLAADEGKTVRIPLAPVKDLLLSGSPEEFEGFLVRSIVRDGHRELALVVKRLADVAGSALGLVILSPVLLATALAIRLREGSPVLFRQTRVGLHGRPFTIYKFRTMVPDAVAHLHEVAHLNTRHGPAFKADHDPRITPLGSFLRRTSLDELPQLWNVLKGEMSLVGPRPPLPHEVADYNIWHRRRLSMRPGITGLWQVEARDEPDFDRWVERDLAYIDGWSPALDIKILLRTIPAVLVRTGK